MSILNRFRTALAWGACCAVLCAFSCARAYGALTCAYVPAEAESAFDAVFDTENGSTLTLTPKPGCAYIPESVHVVAPGYDDDVDVVATAPQASYSVILSDDPMSDASITVTCVPLYAITQAFVPAAAAASFSNNCPAQASARGVVTYIVWGKDGCALKPDFAEMAGAVSSASAVSGGHKFSFEQAISSDSVVTNYCSPLDAWWASGSALLRAAWTDASVTPGTAAFGHGADVFVASGAASKMLVRAQYAAADLTNAVGRLGAASAAEGYEVAVTGLPGTDAATAPAAFAANTAGDKIYAIVGKKILRLDAAYATDAPRKIETLTYGDAWTLDDTPVALAVATVGGVDLAYANVRHVDGETDSYKTIVLDTATGDTAELVADDARLSALAATGVAAEAPHLIRVVADGGAVSSVALKPDGRGVVTLQGLGSFDPSDHWPDAAPDAAFLFASDDERFAFIGGTNTAGRLQAMTAACVPAAVTVRAAMPVANGTNDYLLAYGVATNLTIDAPAGYCFTAVTNGSVGTALDGASSYAFATDARSHASLEFTLAYATEVEVLGPSSAVSVMMPSSVTIGETLEAVVTFSNVDYGLAAATVDGASATVSFDNGTYQISGRATSSGKVVLALHSQSAWYADRGSGVVPMACAAFSVASAAPGEGRSAALDAVRGRLAFGLSAEAADAGIAEFSTADLFDAVATEAVAPVWAENSAGRDGETWGKSIASLSNYAAWVSCNAVVANTTWVNPQGGAWSGEENAAYSAPFTGVPGDGAATLKLSVVAANAAGDALYGASGAKLYKFTVSDDGATPARITGFAYAADWTLAAEPGALAVATVGGRDVVYCAPAAGGALQVVDATRRSAAESLGVTGAFSSLSVSGLAAGTPHLAAVSGTTASYWALSGDGMRALASAAFASRDLATLLGASSAPSGVYFAAFDDELSAVAGCRDGASLRVATIVQTPAQVSVRGRFFDGDANEVGTATNAVAYVQADVTQSFAAPAGHMIVGVKKNGVAVGGLTFPTNAVDVVLREIAAPAYFEIEVGETTSIAVDLLGDAYLVGGSEEALVGGSATLTFDVFGPNETVAEGTVLSSVYVDGSPASVTVKGAGRTNVLTIASVQPGMRVVVASTTPRDAPANPWYAYTSRITHWSEAAADAALPVVPNALDATDAFLLEIFGAGAGRARLSALADAEGGRAATDPVWTLAHDDALFGGDLRGGAVAKPLDVALLGSSNGAFMVSAPLHLDEGETLSAGNVFRVTAVTPAGAAAETPTAFAFSADCTRLYGGSERIAGVNAYRVLDGLKSADTNLVLEANCALGAEGQSCESLVFGTFTHGGAKSFLYAIGKSDRKIYVVDVAAGTAADTGVTAATPYDALALSSKTNATPHLTVFRGATGGADAALVVYEVSDPATGALNATPVKSFTGAQIGKLCGHGSVDASSEGPSRSLAIADNEAYAILGTDWNSALSGRGGVVTRGERVVLGPLAQLTVGYAVNNGSLDGAEEGSESAGEFIVGGVSTNLTFTKADSTYAIRSVTVNGETVDATATSAGCAVALDYTQAAEGRLDVVVDFQVPAVSVWTVGPVTWHYDEDTKTHVFPTDESYEIRSAFSNGVAVALSDFEKYEEQEDERVLVDSGKGFSQEGLTEDVRLVVSSLATETAAEHPWWENPGVRSTTAAPDGATEAAYHFAADGNHFAFTQNGTGRVYERTSSGLVAAPPFASADYPHLAGAGVSEKLNVVLFGTSVPGTPILSAELVSSQNGDPEDPVEISNDQRLALDQFAFSEDGQHLYAICSASATASDREKIWKFSVRHGLKRAGENLILDAAYDFGSAVASFACAKNASGDAVAYALLADGDLAATNLTAGGSLATLRTEPFEGGAAGGSLWVSGAGTAAARVTVVWSDGAQNRIEVLSLAAGGVALAAADPLAAYDDGDFRCLGLPAAKARPAAWTNPDNGTLYFFHGGISEMTYEPTYTITFDVQNGRAHTNGVVVTSPYLVSYRSPCDELDFCGLTEQHYLSAVTTNGVTLAFTDVTASHPTNWTYRGSGADATVSVAFTPAMTATFDLVGGSDMATVVPVEPAEVRPYRPGEFVTFEVQNVKAGYRLAAVSSAGETVACDPTTGQFTFQFVEQGAFVVAFAKTNAWWTAPAVRDTIRRGWLGSVPLGVGCDNVSCDLVFGNGDASHPGLTHYAGAELVETLDPVREPDHQTTDKLTDLSHAEPLELEYEPYSAVSAAAGFAVGSPASTTGGELPYFRFGATWPTNCGFAVMTSEAVGDSMATMKMMAFSDQQVGTALPVLYGYDPVNGKVARYGCAIASERLRIAEAFVEKAFPAGLGGFTCRTVAGRDVLYAADKTHVYAYDFDAGTTNVSAYVFEEPLNAARGVAGLQVVGVADGTPHLVLLHVPYSVINSVDSGETLTDEEGHPVYEEDGTTLKTRIDVVTNLYGGVSVFALSNDCRTIVGTQPLFEHSAGLNLLADSEWGAFAASDDETRAFNVTADGMGKIRLETIEHATGTYYVEAHYVDPFGETIRRDRSYTFTPPKTRLSRTYRVDDRYAIVSVALNGESVTNDNVVTTEKYSYDSGYEGTEDNRVERTVTRYEYVKIVEGFKPVIRQQLVGGVTSSTNFETQIVLSGSPFEATYTPASGFVLHSAATNGVLIDLTALTNAQGVLDFSVPAVYADFDVIVCAKRVRPAVAKPWWENPTIVGSTALGRDTLSGYGVGPAWTDGEWVALPLGVTTPGTRASLVYELSALEQGAADRTLQFDEGDLPFRPDAATAFAPFNLVLYSSRTAGYAVAVPLNDEPLWTNTVDRYANAYCASNAYDYAFDSAAFTADGAHLYANAWANGSRASRIVRFNVKRGLKANGMTLAGGSTSYETTGHGTPVALAVASLPYAANGAVKRDVVFYVTAGGALYAIDTSPNDSTEPKFHAIGETLSPANAGARIAVTGLAAGTPHLVVASASKIAVSATVRVYALEATGAYVTTARKLAEFDAAALGWMGLADPAGDEIGLFATDDDGTLVHVGAAGPVSAIRYADPQVVDWTVKNGSFVLDPGKTSGAHTNFAHQTHAWEFQSADAATYKLAFVLTNGVRMASAPAGDTAYTHAVDAALKTLEVQFLSALYFTNENYRVVGGESIGAITNFSTGYLDPGDHVTGQVHVVKAGWGLMRLELGGEAIAVDEKGWFSAEVTDRNDVKAFFAPTNAWWREPFRRVTITNVLESSNANDVPAAVDEVGGWLLQGNGSVPGLTAWRLAAATNAVNPQLAADRHDNTVWSGKLTSADAATTFAVNPGQWALTGLTGVYGGQPVAMQYPLASGKAWPDDCGCVAVGDMGQLEKWSYGAKGGLYGYAQQKVRRYAVSGGAFVANGDPLAYAHGPRFSVATVADRDVLYGMVSTNLVCTDFAAGTAVTNALSLAAGFGQFYGVSVVAADTTSPRALVAYATWTDACRLAVVALEPNGLAAASPVPLADLSLSDFLGQDPIVTGVLGLAGEECAFVPLNRNRVVVLEKKPETVFVETCVQDALGNVLVAENRTAPAPIGEAVSFSLAAPEGRLFTDLIVDGVRDGSFRTASNYTYAASAQTAYTRVTLVARSAKTISQTMLGPVTAAPAYAANRVAEGESFVAVYTPSNGYYVSGILTNGAPYVFEATQGASVTMNTGALGADVEVTVVASRIRKTAANKWWENPVVVHVHEPAHKASGAYHMGGDGDFVAAGGRPGEPASVLNVATVEDANGGFAVVTNVPGGTSAYGGGVSAALNSALFGHATGLASLAVPLTGARASFAIANSEGVRPLQWVFSADARKAYAPYLFGTKPDTAVIRFNVHGGLASDGLHLTDAKYVGFGKSVWSVAYAQINESELLYAALDDGSVSVKSAATLEGGATSLLAAGAMRLSLTNASLSVCCADTAAPHLAIAEATGTNSALEVFALSSDGCSASATPVLSLDAEHLAAMGIGDATNTFAASVYGLEGGSAAILGWGGNFYAVKYVAPIEVTYGVTNGACDRAEGADGEPFLAKSWFTDDEKRFTFTASAGNVLKKATVNGNPTPFTYGAASFSYVAGADATQHVEVVFLPPACIPEAVGTTYEGVDAENRHVFSLPDAEDLSVTVYSNGVPLAAGVGYVIADGMVRVAPFGALDEDVHLVVAATEPRAPVAKAWHEAPTWFCTYLPSSVPLGDADAAVETGANWSLAATQDYVVDVAGGGRGGATLYRLADLEEKENAPIWQFAYTDDLFGGAPLGGSAVSKPINVALVGTTNGAYMLSLPLALASGEVLDNANTFKITAVQADGVTPTNTPTKFAFSSDGTRLFGVAPFFTGVNEYEVVDGLKAAGAKLKFARNHPFRDAGSTNRSAVAFAYAEVPVEEGVSTRLDHMAFVTDSDGSLYRVSLEGVGTYVWYENETNGVPVKECTRGEHVQLAVAGIAATNIHLYVFREPSTGEGGNSPALMLFDIAQPEQSYKLGGRRTFSIANVTGWTATNSKLYRDGAFCAMVVPDDERSFVFAANVQREDRSQVRYVVRTVPDWKLNITLANGSCRINDHVVPGGLETIKTGTAYPEFTCDEDHFLDAYSVDGVPQSVSIVPPIRDLTIAVSEYNGLQHEVYVHFEKRVINLQLIGGVTAVELEDRSYYVTLPEDLPWELRENGVLVDSARATNLTDNASVIHYTPDKNVAVLNAVFAFYKPRPELEESERWYASGTARAWSHVPTEAGWLGLYAQRHFAGVNWAMDASGSYLLDIAGWKQGGASLYAVENLETGKVEKVGGTAGAQWQVDYTTQLLAGNESQSARFNGGVVSKALGVAAIAVHDGSILPTNTEVMLAMPLELAGGELNNRSVFRVTAFRDDADKTFVKTPRSGAFTADGRYLWGVSDGFTGVYKYEVLDGLKSSGQKLKLVGTIPLTADGEPSQSCASMAYALLGGREVAYALGTNCAVYAVNLTDGTVTNTGVKAGSPHDQLAIAGVGKGIPHLYLARAAITNLADTGNCLLGLYDVNTNTLALTKRLDNSYTPEQVADWCGFTGVEKSWSYYTCAIAVPDNEKSLFMTWNFEGADRQRRYVIQKTSPVAVTLSCAPGVSAFSVATSADAEPTAAAAQTTLSVLPYTRVSVASYSAQPGAAAGYRMARVGATRVSGDATRVTQTNGVWTVGSPAELEVGLGECSDSADTTAADITLAVTQSASGTALSEAEKAAVETNVNAAVSAVGGQQTAAWLETAGWGATSGTALTAADVAAAKDMDVAALLGTEVLITTGVVATITQAAETADDDGAPQLAFTFVVEDGAGNGALALTAEDVVSVVRNFVRKSATLGEDEAWEAPLAKDLDVSLSGDRKSATVTVKMGGDAQGFYKLILK